MERTDSLGKGAEAEARGLRFLAVLERVEVPVALGAAEANWEQVGTAAEPPLHC